MLSPGFDKTEARELLEICAKLNSTRVEGDPSFREVIDTPTMPSPPIPSPAVPKPEKWEQVYALDETKTPDHNYFEIWKSTEVPNRYTLGVRGTTQAIGSIIEDVRALSLPATSKEGNFHIHRPYRLASDPRATVHIGFTLGMMSIIDEVVTQMQHFSSGEGPHEWFITGHSQGAAVATLCRSYLHYQPLPGVENITYKTYVFAQPKPGDTYYGYDFERINFDYSKQSSVAFRVSNTYDWVTEVPLSIQLLKDLSRPNLLTVHNPFKLGKKGLNSLIHPILVLLEKVRFLTSLDYVGCGVPIILPGVEGENTEDENDFFWQHHTGMYYKLLLEQFGT
ncbi:MAG: hypothetical protein AAFY17_14210 [Cyanobacteria bacterium J06642_11]